PNKSGPFPQKRNETRSSHPLLHAAFHYYRSLRLIWGLGGYFTQSLRQALRCAVSTRSTPHRLALPTSSALERSRGRRGNRESMGSVGRPEVELSSPPPPPPPPAAAGAGSADAGQEASELARSPFHLIFSLSYSWRFDLVASPSRGSE
uniref:Uncharacterized protein n=1 Tax=Aegilops tauschii subsp. strangulata TaxID=200361 RepID=A0A453PC78_AEGTS